MLAPISSGPKNRGSSFHRLKNYLISERDPETGESLMRGEVVLSENLLSLDTADAEMEAAAAAALRRARNADPVYHFQLAWQPGEKPIREQWEAAAKKAIADLGFGEHQYMIVAHEDKAHFHVHIMVNKVHPETARSFTPFRDMLTLDKSLREIEHEQGWKESTGHYRWDSTLNAAVRNTREERNEQSNAHAKATGKASRFEHYHDAESLQVYVKDKAAMEMLGILSRSQTGWGQVHWMLYKHGLELKKAEQGGYTVHALGSDLHVKASDVFRRSFAGKANRERTEQKLGPWREASDADRTPSAKSARYDKTKDRHEKTKGRDGKGRDQSKREQKTRERASARQDLKKRFGVYRSEIRLGQSNHTIDVRWRRKALGEKLKTTKKQIRSQAVSWSEKKVLISQAVAASVAEMREFKVAVMRERLELKGRTYQEWVGDLAEKGDLAAAAQLRGWKYQDHRNAAKLDTVVASQQDAAHLSAASDTRQEDWEELTIERIAELRRNEELARMIGAMRWTVNRRSGDVHYTVRGALALVDRGKTISVLTSEETAVVLGLEMAVKKYGMSIKIEGSDQWKANVARIAAKNDVFIQFSDPIMQLLVAQERNKLDKYSVMANQLAGLRDRVAKSPDAVFQLTSKDAAYVFMEGISGLRSGRHIVNELHGSLEPGQRRTLQIKEIFTLEVTRPLDNKPATFIVRPVPGRGMELASLLTTASAKMRQASTLQRVSQPKPTRAKKQQRDGFGRE